LQKSKNSYCKNIIQTLWSLLDEEEDHAKIVKLLKKFEKILPNIFSEVVRNDLTSPDKDVKVRAIKKFAIFWKLTNNSYPKYKPFQEQDTETRPYEALYNMLKVLEDSDPTLRLSCKSWLSESSTFFCRILDPLIEGFLTNSKLFISMTGHIFFQEAYDTTFVIENFGKMRNIILNTQEVVIKYMITNPVTPYVAEFFKGVFQFTGRNFELSKLNYLTVITFVTLEFIMGQAVESIDEKLFQGSQTVNASACEFMELILKSLDSHPAYSK